MNKLLALAGIFLTCWTASLANPHYSSGWGNHAHHNGGGLGRPGHHHGSGGSGSQPTRPPTTAAPSTGVKPETRTLDQLYKAALAEGGKLVVYAGGDAPNQQDAAKKEFEATFPGMTVEIVVDFSKYHDARIDYQLATNSVVVDVTQLQTLQDFPRWASQGALLEYKPIGFERVFEDFKDADGAWTAIFIIAFSNYINTNLLPNRADWPIEAKDYLRPNLKNKIVVTYPNDDDAVLFWFKQVVDKYGYEYLDQFKAQNPHFVRGTAESGKQVREGTYAVTMSTGGGLKNATATPVSPVFVLPEKDTFVVWPQRAAILKSAPHPEAAKLYMSWALDKKRHESRGGWSVRDDVTPPPPYKSIWSYPGGDPLAFAEFMEDREQVEIFKTQIGLVFGQVQGPSPNGDFDMHPVKAFPH